MIIPSMAVASREQDSLIKVLKEELNNKAKYDNLKESNIEKLRIDLIKIPKTNLASRYLIQSQLLDEYISYQRDSALVIGDRLIKLAEQLRDQRKINSARLRMSTILISSGIFKEADECLSLIDITNELQDHKFEYYHLQTWLNWAMKTSINDQLYAPEYSHKEAIFRDSALRYANPQLYEVELIGMFPDAERSASSKNYQKYIQFLNAYYQESPHKAARIAYMYSDLYTDERRTNLLLLAAIYDVRTATKETPAIIKIGEQLFQNGDVNNAFFFLNQAMDNAKFYGSKLHKIEITSILPQVTVQKMLQSERKIMWTVVISIILLFILGWIFYSRIKLKALNQKISVQNVQLQNTLVALEKSQGENAWILKVLAHDLRGAIAGSMSVNAVLVQNENLSDDERMMIRLLDTSNHDALETISDLLNLNSDKYQLNKSNVQLDELVKETAKLFQFKADEKQLQFILQTDPVSIALNREKMRRVLHNLISNAIKFSAPYSHITLAVIDLNKQFVLIKIADKGIGIPAAFKASIFELDPQNRREGTSGEQSFGLGLYICKQIIAEHQGKIWVENNEGNGTIFLIELPK
ncbi:ATP-binding protein [Sphingobacterium sp. HJSM2_6]|uniref:ATP-binding protein n=1 Tax=Sphingobacterium sp. HJSM2_6 TaxID=3366264 RepID=UPI003BC736C3